MSNITFTPQEISVIDKKLGFMVFDWFKYLIYHIISMARNKGIDVLYINSSETLDAGSINEGKSQFFYEKVPPALGFKQENVNLRGKGTERLWAYHLDSKGTKASCDHFIKLAEKTFTIEQIPAKYQGAVIGIIGRKPLYTPADLQKVLAVLEKKDKKPKAVSKYFYDWNRQWTGSQRFKSSVSEDIVVQRLTIDSQNIIQADPILLKFWSLLLSQHQHFGEDVVAFALVSKVDQKHWVINEIQTDAINHYMDIRNDLRKKEQKEEKTEKISWETLVDMLEAQNKSNWIPRLEGNIPLKEQILNEPNIIGQLPDNTHDIDAWIAERRNDNNLMQHLRQQASTVNFNSRVLRTY